MKMSIVNAVAAVNVSVEYEMTSVAILGMFWMKHLHFLLCSTFSLPCSFFVPPSFHQTRLAQCFFRIFSPQARTIFRPLFIACFLRGVVVFKFSVFLSFISMVIAIDFRENFSMVPFKHDVRVDAVEWRSSAIWKSCLFWLWMEGFL